MSSGRRTRRSSNLRCLSSRGSSTLGASGSPREPIGAGRSVPRSEALYGRRKMTAWLGRNGFPGVSKHTVDPADAPGRDERTGPGPEDQGHDPAKDGKRAGDLLNRDFTAPLPNHSWVTDFTIVQIRVHGDRRKCRCAPGNEPGNQLRATATNNPPLDHQKS